IARPTALPDIVLLTGRCVLFHHTLSRLHSIPKVLLDDAQFRHLLDYPLRAGLEPGDPLAGVRILDEALPIPDDPADVHLIVEDAVAALGAAIDRGETRLVLAQLPGSSQWRSVSGRFRPHTHERHGAPPRLPPD